MEPIDEINTIYLQCDALISALMDRLYDPNREEEEQLEDYYLVGKYSEDFYEKGRKIFFRVIFKEAETQKLKEGLDFLQDMLEKLLLITEKYVEERKSQTGACVGAHVPLKKV
jgi:hypothetical protein